MFGSTATRGRVSAEDWPQILGPRRNGTAHRETLATTWNKSLPVAWRFSLGQGYAGPAVADSTVYVFHRQDDQELLSALDATHGTPRWTASFEANYRGGVDPDLGPRCVPLIDGDTVFVFGAAGALHAVARDTGKTRWSRDLYADFGGQEGYFGAGSSPIIAGGHLILNVGGREGAGIVALNPQTGKTVWQATDAAASYASPALVRSDSSPDRVLFATRLQAILLDAASGRVAAQRDFGKRGPTVNAATPIVFDDYAFLTASYGVGAALLKTNSPSLEPVWENDETLSSQYNTPVLVDGHLFGIHGREDIGEAELRCIEALTGRVSWAVPGFGVAHLIAVNDQHLLLLKVDGTLVLAAANAARFRELHRVTVTQGTTRALPAFSDGYLYVRETSGRGGTLHCIDLRP